MRRAGWLLVLLPGGILLALAGQVARLYVAAKTGVDSLDRAGIRLRVVKECIAQFGPLVSVDVVLAMMGIIHNESGGNPAHYLGDLSLPGGPSVGPGQVYRKTAIALDLWTPPEGSEEVQRTAYIELAQDEAWGVKAAVAVFKDKMRIAKGDTREAIRRYNGSGADAEAYATKAQTFIFEATGAVV